MTVSRAVAIAFCVALAAAVPASAATFTVTNTNNLGPGSLRQAIVDANVSYGPDTIAFSIGSGPQSIQPLSPLPSVNGTTIDGTTQPGYAGTPIIEINGSLVGGGTWDGLQVSGSELRALVINGFSGFAVNLSNGSKVRGCYIGTDVTGSQARPNYGGLFAWRDDSPDALVIGGPGPNDGNLISANTIGVYVKQNAVIDGNRFGSNAAGNAVLHQDQHIRLESDRYAMSVGANAPNYFAGGDYGIELDTTRYVTVTGNQIGFSHTGVKFPVGIALTTYDVVDNVISNNTINASWYGVRLTYDTLRVIVRKNAIVGQGFGIDLVPYFMAPDQTPNDAGDFDTGANNLINYPVLTKATSINGITTITGSYSGYANRNITVDFYRSPACHSSGHGPGAAWVGSTGMTTNASGGATFNFAVAADIPAGEVITATATSTLEGTSEFSACQTVEGRGAISFDNISFPATEGTSVAVGVRRQFGSAGPVAVTVVPANGSAVAGTDYPNTASYTVSFADGETQKVLTIPLPDDTAYEAKESFTLTLTNPTGGATLGTPSTTTVTIFDNDPPPSIILPPNLSITEGNSGTKTLSVPVTLSHAAATAISVNFITLYGSASEGQDYSFPAPVLTFAPGETQKTFTINIHGDTNFESDEYFYLRAFSNGISQMQVVITNDDEAPKVSVGNLRVVETDGQHIINVPITATANFTGELYISLASKTATYGSDFTAVDSPWVYFYNESTKNFRVRILGDDETEPDETFTVTIAHVYYGDITVGQRTGTVTIANDDTGVGPSEQSIPLGGGGPIVIDIGEPLDHPVTISVVSSDPETVSVPGDVVLEAGQSSIVVDAKALKAPGSVLVTVTMPAELEGDIFRLRVRTYTPTSLVFDPDPLMMFNGQSRTVKAKLEPAATEPMTFILTSSDTVLVPKTITIPPGGDGTFTVEAKKVGPIFISTRLPRAYGDREVILHGRVRETPASPTVLRISPPDGPSAGGTTVELEGANFVRDCALTFGGTPVTSLQFVTDDLMTAVTPAHDAGTVDVVLTCGEHSSTFTSGFTFTDSAPQLSHVAPSTGNVAGGTHVRIGGSNLRSSCWPFFDGVPAPSASLESPASMLAVTPPHAADAADLLLKCTGGEASLENAFFYTEAEEPAASITTVVPLAAAPGEEVTVLGTRFRPTDRVAFTMPFATIVRTAPDKHVVIVPEVNAQRYSIDVIDIAGRATTTGPIFTVLEATRPRVTAIVPQSAPAGAEIELQGEGFRAGNSFSIADKPATIVQSSYTRAIVRLGTGIVPGQYDVHVINSAGNIASIGPEVNVTAGGLSITGISKNCATTSGGGTITITGTGFEGALLVTFDSVPATNVTIVDESTLTATIPAAEAGPAQIRIVNGDGEAATFTGAFRYTSPFDPNGCTTVIAPTKGRSVRH